LVGGGFVGGGFDGGGDEPPPPPHETMPMTLEIKSEFLKQFMRSSIDRGTIHSNLNFLVLSGNQATKLCRVAFRL
jgi:hypothetical protein